MENIKGLMGSLILLLSCLNLGAQRMDLSTMQWKNRIVLISGETSNAAYIKQQKIFASDSSGIADRKLLLLSSKEVGLSPEVRKILEKYPVLLIGLDGGVKEQSTEPFELKELFDLIDKMPMRRWKID